MKSALSIRLARIATGVAIAVVGTVGVSAIASANSRHHDDPPTTTSTSTVATTTSTVATTTTTARPRPKVTLSGTVKSVSGDVITLSGAFFSNRTVTVGATTTYTESGAASSLAAVVVGANLVATGIESGSTLDAATVAITPPPPVVISGTLSAVSPSSITVTEHGSSTILALASTVVVTEGKTTVTTASLATGEHVVVTESTTAAATATKVSIVLSTLSGIVKSVSGNVITLKGAFFANRTVTVGATTTYTEGGTASSLASVVSGTWIVVTGIESGTTLDAITVAISAR